MYWSKKRLGLVKRATAEREIQCQVMVIPNTKEIKFRWVISRFVFIELSLKSKGRLWRVQQQFLAGLSWTRSGSSYGLKRHLAKLLSLAYGQNLRHSRSLDFNLLLFFFFFSRAFIIIRVLHSPSCAIKSNEAKNHHCNSIGTWNSLLVQKGRRLRSNFKILFVAFEGTEIRE